MISEFLNKTLIMHQSYMKCTMSEWRKDIKDETLQRQRQEAVFSPYRAIALKSTLGTQENNCQLNQRKASVKCEQSPFYHETDLLLSSLFTDSADVMTMCFKAERLFWKMSVRACIMSEKWQHTTAQYESNMSLKRQVWQCDFSSCRSFIFIIDVGFFLRSWQFATCKWVLTTLI